MEIKEAVGVVLAAAEAHALEERRVKPAIQETVRTLYAVSVVKAYLANSPPGA